MTTRTKVKPGAAPMIPWWNITLRAKGKQQVTLPVVAGTEEAAIEQAKRCLVQGAAFKLNTEQYETQRDSIEVINAEQLTAVSR